MIKKKYNIEEYPFIELVKSVYEIKNLSKLHIYRGDFPPSQSQLWAQESNTTFHKLFYEKLNQDGPFSWADKDHQHPDGEINFQIALTEMKKTYCTWVEPVPGCNYYVPLEMSPGEFYIFNGNKCTHGNKNNISELTRISLDFRVIPVSALKENKTLNKTATTKVSFAPGGYYKERVYNVK